MKRIFRYNGQVLDRIDTYEDASILSTDATAADEVATALSVDVKTITVAHVEKAPLVEVVIPPTPAPEAQVTEPVVPVGERVAKALNEAPLPDDIKAALAGVISELLA